MDDPTGNQPSPFSHAAGTPRASSKTPRKRRRWIGVVAILAVLGVAWGAWMLINGAGKAGGFGARGARPATTVGVAVAGVADVPIIIEALGTVTPAATVTVRPQVSGVITKVLFREGQMVKRGQALAIIDPRPLQMALLQAQGQLQRDEAQLANARLTLTRYRTLLAQDSIARQDVDTQAATTKQFEGTVVTDRAAVGTARLNLGYSRITAPVSGRVGLRAVDVGNYIGAGDTNGIVVLTEVDPIDVEFTVPQDDAPRIMARAAKATLPVTALDRTRTNQLAAGSFSTLDNQVDTTTGTVKAKARFANGTGALFPNQFVNIRLELDTIKNAVVAPVTAVRTGPNGDFVWTVHPGNYACMRMVTRGETTATQVVLTTGVQAGEKLITEGGDRLTQGGRIVLPGAKPGGAGGKRHGGAQAGGDPTAQGAPAGQAGAAGAPGGGKGGRRGAGAPGKCPAPTAAPPAGVKAGGWTGHHHGGQAAPGGDQAGQPPSPGGQPAPGAPGAPPADPNAQPGQHRHHRQGGADGSAGGAPAGAN